MTAEKGKEKEKMVKRVVAGLLLAVAFAVDAAAKPDDGWFTFVSWNMGHHAMGLKSRPTIPPGQDEAYLHMYKTFIGDARIVGVCEYSAEFTTNQPLKTAEVLFGGYGVKIEGTRRGAQCNSLFMKGCKLLASKEREYPKRSQRVYYQFARVLMDGREVCVVETHLDWDLGEKDTLPRREWRADQMRTIVADLANEKYVIIGGDFNIKNNHPGDTKEHATEFDVFAEAGYTLANRGQLITWPSWHNPKRECPIDNIIVKGFEMSDVQVRGHDKLSDHKMISCRLKFIDWQAKTQPEG